MEPKILIVGRNLEVMDILKAELSKFGRNIISANSNELIAESLSKKDVDLVVVGAGLPDHTYQIKLIHWPLAKHINVLERHMADKSAMPMKCVIG